MSRKDYILIAKAIKNLDLGNDMEYIKDMIITCFSHHLRKDNPLFNAAKFQEACKDD